MKKLKNVLFYICFLTLIAVMVNQNFDIREVMADLGDRWSVDDDRQRDIVSIPTPIRPGADYMEWSTQCTPGTAETDTIRLYMRTKGGTETLMGKDDGSYEFQVGGPNTFINQGCDVSGVGADNSVGTAVTTALEFGRGTWFNLLRGGTFTGGFQTTNIDEKGRIIYLVANQKTILVDGLGTTNLDLGGCNLNMGAGRIHAFWFDGCKWHLMGHHNDW